MESNQTITLAGETLTSEDWPRGSPYFDDDDWVFGMLDPECDFPEPIRIDDADTYQFGIIAAVARVWFLDKAEEAWEDSEFSMQCDCPETSRYLASADKWARIGKGAKG